MITLTGRMLALLSDPRPAGLRLSGFLFAPWRAPVTSAHPWYDEPAGPRRSDLIAVEGSRESRRSAASSKNDLLNDLFPKFVIQPPEPFATP